MRPINIEHVGSELAIKWEDGHESFIQLEILRRQCPCAGCKGETDIMGNVYKDPERTLTPKSFELAQINPVGNYAVNLVWADGHGSGIYTFDFLRRLEA